MTTGRFTVLSVLCSILATTLTPAVAGSSRPCDDATLHASAEDIGSPPDFTGFGSSVSISGRYALVGLPNYVNEVLPTTPTGRVAVYTCDARTHTAPSTCSSADKAYGGRGNGSDPRT